MMTASAKKMEGAMNERKKNDGDPHSLKVLEDWGFLEAEMFVFDFLMPKASFKGKVVLLIENPEDLRFFGASLHLNLT